MSSSKLCEFDANLYRLYAVGLLKYDEALSQARSDVLLRRAMLAFDHNTRTAPSAPVSSPLSPPDGALGGCSTS